MNDVTTLGIDIAKNVFQLHGLNDKGETVLKKRLSRAKLATFIANLKPCLIGIEACATANYWARKFSSFGFEVKLINPKYVKPYVKTNKNDYKDAEAIAEAVTRPNMRFVPIKDLDAQDIQSLHRIRSQALKHRTALSNQIRSLLSEYGVVLPQNIRNVRKLLPGILEDGDNELTFYIRELLQEQYQELVHFDTRISTLDAKIEEIYNTNASCQKISTIPGIGKLTATAVISVLTNPSLFKNGREFAAWLGLVPRNYSSGNKYRLGGISKRGDIHLRTLLIHGARSVVIRAKSKEGRLSKWVLDIKERSGFNKACVALANKNARIIWSVLNSGKEFNKAA